MIQAGRCFTSSKTRARYSPTIPIISICKPDRNSSIDMMLVHYPGPKTGWPLKRGQVSPADWTPAMREETWRALEDLKSEGCVRNIGVSNYARHHLEQLLRSCRVRPLVNQVELHPFLPQTDLVQYCKAAGVHIQAFASLGGGDSGGKSPLLAHRLVQSIAAALEKTPPRCCCAGPYRRASPSYPNRATRPA